MIPFQQDLLTIPNSNATFIIKLTLAVFFLITLFFPYLPSFIVAEDRMKAFYYSDPSQVDSLLTFRPTKVDFSLPLSVNMTQGRVYDLRIYEDRFNEGICCQEVTFENKTYLCKNFSLVGYYYNDILECKDRNEYNSLFYPKVEFTLSENGYIPTIINIEDYEPIHFYKIHEVKYLGGLNFGVTVITLVIIILICYDNFYLADSLESTPFFSVCGIMSQLMIFTYNVMFSSTIIALIALMFTCFLLVYSIALVEFFKDIWKTWHSKVSIFLFIVTEIYLYLEYLELVQQQKPNDYIMIYILATWIQLLFCFVDFFHLSEAYRFLSLYVIYPFACFIFLIILGYKDGFGLTFNDYVALYANTFVITILLLGLIVLIIDLGNDSVEFIRIIEYHDDIDQEVLRENLFTIKQLITSIFENRSNQDRRLQRRMSQDVLISLDSIGINQIEELEILCPICLDGLKKEEMGVHKTSCGHYFHKECLREWRVEHRTCPNCRSNLTGN